MSCGRGSSVTQILALGVRNIAVAATGSDVACQLDETQPCQTVRCFLHWRSLFLVVTYMRSQVQFALQRFAGPTRLPLTMSSTVRGSITLANSDTISAFPIVRPLLLQAAQQTVVVSCVSPSSPCLRVSSGFSDTFEINGLTMSGQTSTSTIARGGALAISASVVAIVRSTFVQHSVIATGGAVFCSTNSQVTISDSVFFRNTAGQAGAGLFADTSVLRCNNCTFSSNTVTSLPMFDSLQVGGAGLFAAFSSVQLLNNTFLANTVGNGVAIARGGGASMFSSNVVVRGATFLGNSAPIGGGLAFTAITPAEAALIENYAGSSLSVQQTLIQNNVALDTAGGVYVDTAPVAGFVGVSLLNNRATNNGGALAVLNSASFLSDCIVVGNEAAHGNGAALFLQSSPANISASTISHNTCPQGGGGAVYWERSKIQSISAALPHFTSSSSRTGNAAAFGADLASEPFSIVFSNRSAADFLQTSSAAIWPTPVVAVLDYYNHTVTNQRLVVSASPAADFAGDVAVFTVEGIASFSDLILRSIPSSRSSCSFSVTTALGQALQTDTIVLQAASCSMNTYFSNQTRVCESCPTGMSHVLFCWPHLFAFSNIPALGTDSVQVRSLLTALLADSH